MALTADRSTVFPVNRFMVQQGAAGTTPIAAAAGAGIKHKVILYSVQLGAAGSLKFTDGGGDISPTYTTVKDASPIAASGIASIPFVLCETAPNSPLNIVTTGGAGKGLVIFLTEP